MKKILALLAVMVACVAGVRADEYVHDTSVLPQAALTTVNKNFKAKVSVIKVDRDFGRVSEYEVILTDGSEITFDSKGNWKEVEVAVANRVPAAFIPAGVQKYVSANQPQAHVVGIEKERKGYEVKLSNGVEMKFDANGNFKRYD